jgi:hypothetical protein
MKKIFYLFYVLLFSLVGCTDNDNPVLVDKNKIVKYIARMSQQGKSDPTVLIMENTLGEVKWTRIEEGQYKGIIAETISPGGIYCNLQLSNNSSHSFKTMFSNNEIIIFTYDNDIISDGILLDALLEVCIRLGTVEVHTSIKNINDEPPGEAQAGSSKDQRVHNSRRHD